MAMAGAGTHRSSLSASALTLCLAHARDFELRVSPALTELEDLLATLSLLVAALTLALALALALALLPPWHEQSCSLAIPLLSAGAKDEALHAPLPPSLAAAALLLPLILLLSAHELAQLAKLIL